MLTDLMKQYQKETGSAAFDVLCCQDDADYSTIYVEGITPGYHRWLEGRASRVKGDSTSDNKHIKQLLCDLRERLLRGESTSLTEDSSLIDRIDDSIAQLLNV